MTQKEREHMRYNHVYIIISLPYFNFQLAENLDGQLARMCEDLKEIISHLNTSAKSQDSRDPVHQIGKVRCQPMIMYP